MGLREAWRTLNGLPEPVQRSDPRIGFDTWAWMFQQVLFNGVQQTVYPNTQEDPGFSFQGLAQGAYKSNSVVYACIKNRIDLFSEAKFTFRRRGESRSGTFSNGDLRILQTPWEGATTGDLLARMLLFHDIAGNAYAFRRGNRIFCPRPDWVTIIGGVPGNGEATVWHPDARVLGYAYQEGGPGGGKDPVVFLPEEVAHFATEPDPELRFMGMSPLRAAVREIMADKAATDHKLKFFENAATPNMVVKLDVTDLEVYRKWIEAYEEKHEGVSNAYKTLFLGAGADATVVGANLQQLEFKVTQGAGETRIAAALGVPPVVVGLSEGLAAATYSNYAQARRRFADQTIRPLWRNVCGSLANILNVPPDAELWYDDRDIAALQEDLKDRAEVQQFQATTIKTLVDAGYEPDAVIQAVVGEDYSGLKTKHTGLFSVQLQEPVDPNAPKELPAAQPQKALPAPQREIEPTNVEVSMPDVHITTPDVRLDAPITVNPPAVHFDAEAIKIVVEVPEQRTVELPVIEARYRKKRIELPSGQKATVTERDGETEIEFEDGRTATVKEIEDE